MQEEHERRPPWIPPPRLGDGGRSYSCSRRGRCRSARPPRIRRASAARARRGRGPTAATVSHVGEVRVAATARVLPDAGCRGRRLRSEDGGEQGCCGDAAPRYRRYPPGWRPTVERARPVQRHDDDAGTERGRRQNHADPIRSEQKRESRALRCRRRLRARHGEPRRPDRAEAVRASSDRCPALTVRITKSDESPDAEIARIWTTASRCTVASPSPPLDPQAHRGRVASRCAQPGRSRDVVRRTSCTASSPP